MADKLILERISKRNLDGIYNDVKAYFSSVLEVKKPKNGELKEKGMFSVKFLHSTVAVLGSDTIPTQLMQAIHLCCHTYKLASKDLTLQDELSVPKLVYHIINRIVQEDLLDHLHQLGTFLYECLEDVTVSSNPAIKPIVLSSYSKLWNVSVKYESSCSTLTSHLTSTNLRFLALKFLFKKEQLEDADVDKIEIVLGRYIQLAFKMKGKKNIIQKDLCRVLESFVAMIKHVFVLDKERFGLSVLKSVTKAVKYLTQYKVMEDMHYLLDFVEEMRSHDSLDESTELLVSAVSGIVTVLSHMDKIHQGMANDSDFEKVSTLLMSANENLMTFMDADNNSSGQRLAVVMEICQLVLLQLKSISLGTQLATSFMDAARMTMTLYLHFLESEWRQIGESKPLSCGLRRDQIERNMLDAFHVKFQMFFRLVQVSSGEECAALVAECLEAVLLYLNVLDIVESDKTRYDDKYYFGYLMVKFGNFCYNNGMDEAATEFYRNTCQQLTEYCCFDNDKKPARIEETSLWRMYKCLAECHRRRQMWQESLETIATYFHIDLDHSLSLVQLWVRIKRDAVREGHKDFTDKTLKDVFEEEEMSAESVLSLLQSELEAFREFKTRWPEGEVVVLHDLATVSCQSHVKAQHLLTLTQLLWTHGLQSHSCVKDYLNQVFVLVSPDRPAHCVLHAQALIWKFIMGREQLCKKYLQPAAELDLKNPEDDSHGQKSAKDEPFALCKVYSLQQSETDMADMEQALSYLSQGMKGDIPPDLDRQQLVHSLTIAASVFRLFRKPLQELQSLCLALRASPCNEGRSVEDIRQSLSRVLVECGQYYLADLSLPFIGQNGIAAENGGYQTTLLQLQKDRILLVQKDESGLLRTQSTVDKLVKANSKSWTATLTEGVAKRLLSMYLIQPVKQPAGDAEHALALAQEAVRLHTGVVHFLLGKDMFDNSRNKEPNLLDQWLVVTELLESILHLGHLYRHVGDAKDARCYLKEGLKITKSLCLPKWTAEFLLELGRINSLSCNEKETMRLLCESALVLRSNCEGDKMETKSQIKLTSTKVTKSKKQPSKKKNASVSKSNCKVAVTDPIDDCFGFESVRDAGVKRPSESDVTSMLSNLTLSEDLDVLESNIHNIDCKCQLCADIVVRGLEMLFSETLGEFYQYSGSLEKGWEELKKIETSRSVVDNLTSKAGMVIQENLQTLNIFQTKSKKQKIASSQVSLPQIKQVSIESYSLLAQTALKKCDTETAQFLSKSALDMLNSDTNKDLLQQSFLKAQLQLLQIQAKIRAGGEVFTPTEKVAPVKATRARGKLSTKRKTSSKTTKLEKDEEGGENNDDCVKEALTDAFVNICHFPSSDVYGNLCRMLACQHLDSDQTKTAYYLGEAVSITFRHKALVNTSYKIRKLEKEVLKEGLESSLEDNLQDLKHVRSLLTFNKDVNHFNDMLRFIPPEWTVCQVTLVTGADNQCGMLLLTRLTGHSEPLTVQLPGLDSVQGRSVLPEFKSIMKTSSDSMKLTDKNVWWNTRRDLNDRMQTVLELIEKFWLGKWACLLQGQRSQADLETLKTAASKLHKDIKKTCKLNLDESALEHAASLCWGSSEEDQREIVVRVLHLEADSDTADKVCNAFTKCLSALSHDSYSARQPLLLILDKDVQHLPWESLPCLRRHPVTRIPSLYHLHTQLSVSRLAESHACIRGVDLHDAFYILNPDNDLMSTQESFEALFSSQPGWSGLVGEKPDQEKFKTGLMEHDLFLYCGHGSGGKYFSGTDLQQLTCRAVAVLMGCSSGHLQTHGILEATGMINNYFLAGCPTIIANLWDVTDRDIDRFLEAMLNSWIAADGEGSLLDPIPAARDMCRLPFLIGAAPVVYGFPVNFTQR